MKVILYFILGIALTTSIEYVFPEKTETQQWVLFFLSLIPLVGMIIIFSEKRRRGR